MKPKTHSRLILILLMAFLVTQATATVKQMPSQSLATSRQLAAEIEALRQLADLDEPDQLATNLDRSVARVPAGEFIMGSNTHHDNERPQHIVYLDAFEIDRYEVTNAQYQRFVKAAGREPPLHWSGSDYPPGQADYPVVDVAWVDAEAYCAWAGKRLPTEAEWEKACRGADGRTFPWGDEWRSDRANVNVSTPPSKNIDNLRALLAVTPATSSAPGLRPVGSYPGNASPYGVLDMVGNASEWVADWYNWGGYQDMPATNPLNLSPPWNRCLRGSAWFDPYGGAAWAQDQSRCSARNSSHVPTDPRVGFRCARPTP